MSIYTLGLAYGLTGFCTGPILGSILVLAAAGGQPVRGGLLLAIYGLGMVVPLVVLALTWGSIGQRVNRWLRGRTVRLGRLTFHSTSLISGLVLVAVGVFMVVNGGNLVESNTLALAGARAEEWATNLGGRAGRPVGGDRAHCRRGVALRGLATQRGLSRRGRSEQPGYDRQLQLR